jgi:hypothetical protein
VVYFLHYKLFSKTRPTIAKLHITVACFLPPTSSYKHKLVYLYGLQASIKIVLKWLTFVVATKRLYMKKCLSIILLVVVSVAFFVSDLSAQNNKISLPPDMSVNQYDIIAEAYYGYPYLMGILYKQILADTFGLRKITNMNHIGFKAEYMRWESLGLGVEYTYALLSMRYQGSNGKYYTAGIGKKRILAKVSYHHSVDEHFDFYYTAGIGYTITNFSTDEPGIKAEKINVNPVASRVGIGLRYFFNETFGLNAEAGLGGPLIQIGISIKP